MAITIFLSNKSIQIIKGKRSGKSIYVDRIIETAMPGDAILNGVVVEGGEDAISDKLKEIWKSNGLSGSADLVINSPKLISDRKEMPIITKAGKVTDYLDKQISSEEFSRFESPVKGWYLLNVDSKEKVQNVVTEIAEQKALEAFIRIFSKAGIPLKSIHEGVSLATIMFSHCVGNTPSVYMIRDDNMLVTILFVDGKYYYDSSRRIFQQPGTSEFIAEILSNVNGIKQFAKSQKIQDPIANLYFAGISKDDVSILQKSLHDSDPEMATHSVVAPSHIHFKTLSDKFSSFVYPVSGLYLPGTGYDLLTAIRKNDEEYTRKHDMFKKLIPALVLTLLLSIITIFFLIVYLSSSAKLKEYNDYNNSPDVIESAAEYDILVSKAGETGLKQGGADVLKEYINSYPIPDSAINDKILAAAEAESVNIDFSTYESTSGVFSTTATSPYVENINRFIAMLLEMDIFENVDYTGYEWNDEESAWSINVICTLSENASKEGK